MSNSRTVIAGVAPRLFDLPAPPPGRSGWPWTVESQSVCAEDLAPISIVMPSLTQARHPEEAIRSVLLQGYPKLELLVMDGGSTDGSVQILEKYSKWIDWISEPDRGQSHAINKGLERIRGDIFTWFNSDDLLLPDAIGAVAKAFGTMSEAIFVAALVRDFGRGRRKLQGSRNLVFRNLVEFWTPERGVMRDQGLFFSSRAIAECGLLDESLDYIFDYDFLIRVCRRFRPVYLDTPVAAYRFHSKSKTVRNAHEWIDEQVKVASRYWSELEGLDHDARDRFLAGARLRRGIATLIQEPRAGVRLMSHALRAHPRAALWSTILYLGNRLTGGRVRYEESPRDEIKD